MSTEKEREAHREAMYGMIRRYESSRESRKLFCEKESIALSTFTYWLRRYLEQQSESAGSFMSGGFRRRLNFQFSSHRKIICLSQK